MISSVQGRMWENGYRTTIVCVDTYDRNNVTGRLYNPFLPKGEEFQGLMDLIWKMEALLDGMQFPQPFTEDRSFRERKVKLSSATAGMETKKGKVGTFAVRILFRQNASWQGTVSWVEGKQERNFRSALELLKSMDSALYREETTE